MKQWALEAWRPEKRRRGIAAESAAVGECGATLVSCEKCVPFLATGKHSKQSLIYFLSLNFVATVKAPDPVWMISEDSE